MKFRENPSTKSRVVPRGQTDRQNWQTYSRFSQFVNAPKNGWERYPYVMHRVTYVAVELKRFLKTVGSFCGFNATEGKRF